MALPDNPKDAVAHYIDYLYNDFLIWYNKSVRKNYRLWFYCQILSLMAGFGTSLLAALMHGSLVNQESAVLQWLLILLPFFGSIAATIVVQSKVVARWQLREKGRRDIELLLHSAKQRYASASTPEEYKGLHIDLIASVKKIEEEQSCGYFENKPSFSGN